MTLYVLLGASYSPIYLFSFEQMYQIDFPLHQFWNSLALNFLTLHYPHLNDAADVAAWVREVFCVMRMDIGLTVTKVDN
jgi:hypothetical protein